MEKSSPANKIYVVLVGSAPMSSLDALLISLDRFKNTLSSDSARDQFDTAIRSIQPDLKSVHTFVDTVYSRKDPRFAITMTGRTLVVEIEQSKSEFLDCIHDHDVEEILSHITAVGSMPAKKIANQPMREYTVFPIRFANGKFIKVLGAF